MKIGKYVSSIRVRILVHSYLPMSEIITDVGTTIPMMIGILDKTYDTSVARYCALVGN